MSNKTETVSRVESRPRLFERVMAGLEEGIAYARGEIDLRRTELTLPGPPPTYDAQRVRTLRTELGLSQPSFSRLLNVSPKTVQSWEQGARRPGQSAARLLQLIENPDLLVSLRRVPAVAEAVSLGSQ